MRGGGDDVYVGYLITHLDQITRMHSMTRHGGLKALLVPEGNTQLPCAEVCMRGGGDDVYVCLSPDNTPRPDCPYALDDEAWGSEGTACAER